MRIEQSVIIHCARENVFAFLEHRANDAVWMKTVTESEWLDQGTSLRVGRRGRMVMKVLGWRTEFVDEVIEYVPGHRIGHRTIEGPLPLITACICESAEGGCRATVVAELERIPGGPLGRLAMALFEPMLRRGFKADLSRLKALLEQDKNVRRAAPLQRLAGTSVQPNGGGR